MTVDDQKDALQPNSDQIYDVIVGSWRAHILKTAIQLDLFNIIDNGQCTVDQISSIKNWLERPTRILLDGLCPLYLTKEHGKYVLTPLSKSFLICKSETFAGDAIKHFLSCEPWQEFAGEAIKTGKLDIPNASDTEFSYIWEQDATLEAKRTSRITESLEMWRTVGIDPDSRQGIRILDLACGCAVKSLVLARNPQPTRY